MIDGCCGGSSSLQTSSFASCVQILFILRNGWICGSVSVWYVSIDDEIGDKGNGKGD